MHEEYLPAGTTDFTAGLQRLIDKLKDQPGRKFVWVVWAGAPSPFNKFAELELQKRYGIEMATGGNILPAMVAYKQYPGMEGALYYYFGIPKNPVNEWLVANHYKQFKSPPDFFTAGGMSAAIAVVEALKKTDGDTNTDKLIATMEGMSFETPKGKMTFRKEDHQAMQDMYHFKIKVDPAFAWGVPELVREIKAERDGHPHPQQALKRLLRFPRTHSSPEPPPGGGSSQKDEAGLRPARLAMLETQDLTIRFGGHVAVDHVSCRFEPGTLTSIVGPNGAGKTTYFNLISGQLPASEGRVLLDGEDITTLPAPLRTRRGLGRAFQLTQLFPNLSCARERAPGDPGARGGPRARRARPLARVAGPRGLDRRGARHPGPGAPGRQGARRTASALPHGDQRKLEVALLIALDPKVFMFDEPTAGMSVDEVPVVLDLIRMLKDRKDVTILLVEHKMDVVRELSDRIIVLHNGQLVADGEPAAVIASPVVQQAYLGVVDAEVGLAAAADGTSPGPSPPSGEAPSMSHDLLDLRGVHTHIGAYHILHGVDLVVPEGEVTMLLGRNGAGKTTTLRTIMGLWQASAGELRFRGQSLDGPGHARHRGAGHRLRAREHGHLHRPDGEGEHRARRARGAPRGRARHARGWSGSSACSRR